MVKRVKPKMTTTKKNMKKNNSHQRNQLISKRKKNNKKFQRNTKTKNVSRSVEPGLKLNKKWRNMKWIMKANPRDKTTPRTKVESSSG